MSDLAMYEAMASAAIRQHRNDARALRRKLTAFEADLLFATGEKLEGLRLVQKRLAEKLRELGG